MGLLSKMYGQERFQAGLDQVWSQINSNVNTGNYEFTVTVREHWFAGRFDNALERVIAALQAEGVAVRNIDVQGWSGVAHLALLAVPADAAPSPAPTAGGGSPFTFDPQGPEKSAAAGEQATDPAEAFAHYVKAVDRLHDFYVYEQFRNRQPSPADAWIVNGLVKSLALLRLQQRDPDVVREGVTEATHRLRTITTALEGAGGNAVLYRSGLDGLAREAPDVDVSEVFWS